MIDTTVLSYMQLFKIITELLQNFKIIMRLYTVVYVQVIKYFYVTLQNIHSVTSHQTGSGKKAILEQATIVEI